MQREGLLEESAVPQNALREAKFNMVFRVAAILAFLVLGVFVFSAFGYIPYLREQGGAALAMGLISYIVLLLLILGAGLLLWFLKDRFNVSYDYTFVEDELRITKVLNGRKRKYLTTLQADRILQIGWVESDAYERAVRGLERGKKPRICTPNKAASEGKELIYLINSTSMEKMIYVVEIRRIMLENLVLAAGRNKLERRQ